MDPYVEFAARLQTVNYFEVSIAALFTYDYLYNLEDEITLIWKENGWGLGKVLFVLVHYIPFAIFPLSFSAALPAYVNAELCAPLFFADTILHVIAITISECIFLLRCYAMWNGSRVIFAISCFTLTASITSLVVILGRFLPSVTFGEPPLPIIHGCYKTGANSTLFVCFVVIMISEAIIISLTLYRAHKHFHYAPNALLQRLTRDGVFYCLSVFAMSVTNVLVIFLLPIQYSELLNTYQAVMHTILASRMQLHLRKVDRHIHLAGPPIDVCLSPMSFSRSVGLPDV